MALDVADVDVAVELARRLSGEVGGFKVGLELFCAHGPDAVRAVAAHGPVFLDLKLHDIPTTVERTARVIARLGVAMFTVHASGGPTMIAAAHAGAATVAPAPLVLAVTVLTSLSDDELAALGQPPAAVQVPRLAELAVGAGADGVVCAPTDVAAVRSRIGPGPLVVSPGIRSGSGTDDHARGASAAAALAAGADRLVVGRPITTAPDPVAAARALRAEVGR